MGDRERIVRPEDMATTSTAVSTVPQQLQGDSVERVAVITLRPTATATSAQTRKKVVWTEDTVDNENMNKKKSKCCCIYEKPRKFGESESDSSDDECEHCFGHVEKRHASHAGHARHAPHTHTHPVRQQTLTITETEQTDSASTTEPIATISLQPPAPAFAPSPPDTGPSST